MQAGFRRWLLSVGRCVLLGWLVTGVAMACAPSKSSAKRLAQLERCHVQGGTRLAGCATIEVPLVHSDAKLGTIPLRVAVFEAESRTPSPDPIFLLAGGPGQAATEAFPQLLPAWSRMTATRDIVLIDVRGTGASKPLDCPQDRSLEAIFRTDNIAGSAKRCAALFASTAKYHTTAALADDLDVVRAQLGYERINLLGVSYGTRLALEYARRHPKRLRTMVLDSVAPPTMVLSLSFALDGQRALDQMFDRCAKNADCHKSFPNLKEDFHALLASLDDGKKLTIHHPHTGKPIEILLRRHIFAQAIRGLLYAPLFRSLLPLTIQQAKQGNFDPFVAQIATLAGGAQEGMSEGLFLSIACAEDIPRLTEKAIVEQSRASFLGDSIVREFQRACAHWPSAAHPKGFGMPVSSEVPTLLLSGELDPVTPPRWAEEALATLPNGRHIVVPDEAHGVAAIGCVPRLLERFLNEPQKRDFDAGCIDDHHGMKFFLDFAGPG